MFLPVFLPIGADGVRSPGGFFGPKPLPRVTLKTPLPPRLWRAKALLACTLAAACSQGDPPGAARNAASPTRPSESGTGAPDGSATGVSPSQTVSRKTAPAGDSHHRGDSHQRMVEALRQIRTQTKDRHPFLGNRALRQAEADLQTALASPNHDPQDLSRRHGVLGEELLRAGKTLEAIEHTQQALDLLPDDGDPQIQSVRKYALYRLAIANLRLGENANCVACANGESCLFPIQGAGVHEDKTGSQAAVEHLLAVLALDPEDLKARWLLNVAHMTLGSWPQGVPDRFLISPEALHGPMAHDTSSQTSPADEIRPFRNAAAAAGLDALNLAGSVIVDDFDGDDYLDVVRSTWDTAGQLFYYRNRRDGTFVEESEKRGLTGILGGLNLLQADYDNDGDADILVLRGAWLEQEGQHPKSLLRNDGRGRFRDVTFEVGLGEVHYPTQTASWADYDNDGDLDLFVGNEGPPCQLFENDGQGRFIDVAARAGVQNMRLAKGVIWGDYNADRWPDLYVSNLPGENRLYRNNGDKTFTDVAAELGVDRPIYSFPAWFWDYNNDGLLDLYVASFTPDAALVCADYLGRPPTVEGDCFYRGLPGGRFEQVAQQLGFTRVTTPMGSNFGDIDNDGFLDFYLGVGYVDYEGLIPNLLFHNRQGERFEDVTFKARVGHLQKGHGVALADLDNDGDQDIFAQMGGWFTGDAAVNCLFENPGGGGGFLDVRLVGSKSNRSAIGARITVTLEERGGTRSIHRWVNSGGTFGANPLRQHFGVGSAERISRLEVYWPTSDSTQVFHDLPIGARIEIEEGASQLRELDLKPTPFPASAPQPVRHESPSGEGEAAHGE